MADRKCSLCGQYYTDETGHDYDVCVEVLKARLNGLRITLKETREHLKEARKVQGQDWWKRKVVAPYQ